MCHALDIAITVRATAVGLPVKWHRLLELYWQDAQMLREQWATDEPVADVLFHFLRTLSAADAGRSPCLN